MSEDAPADAVVRRSRNRSQRQLDDSAELKASIVAAAAEIFAERGYGQTTLDMVARKVGLTRPGVLHHFSSKDTLFAAVLSAQRQWATRRIKEHGPQRGLAGIAELRKLIGTTELSRTQLRLIHVLEGESLAGNSAASDYVQKRSFHVREYVYERLLEARTLGEIAANRDLGTLTTLVLATINGLQRAWLLNPGRGTGDAFDVMLELLTSSDGDN